MVLALFTQSQGRGRADGRTGLIRGPHHNLALDADLCPGGSAPAARSGQAQRIDLAHGRNLCANRRPVDVRMRPMNPSSKVILEAAMNGKRWRRGAARRASLHTFTEIT